MFDDRDFIAGKNIMENIIDNLQESQKILLMLTPNFVGSGPCMFEHKQAMYLYNWVEKREHCSVPVLLRPCEIPSQLKGLTYVDGEKESSLIANIIQSYDINGKSILVNTQHVTIYI